MLHPQGMGITYMANTYFFHKHLVQAIKLPFSSFSNMYLKYNGYEKLIFRYI